MLREGCRWGTTCAGLQGDTRHSQLWFFLVALWAHLTTEVGCDPSTLCHQKLGGIHQMVRGWQPVPSWKLRVAVPG